MPQEFEKYFRGPGKGGKFQVHELMSPTTPSSHFAQYKERYDFLRENTIIDRQAETLLRNNTKKVEGISDLPKYLEEQKVALPGYGLPKIPKYASTKNRPVHLVSPTGGKKFLPVASNTQKSINYNYREEAIKTRFQFEK